MDEVTKGIVNTKGDSKGHRPSLPSTGRSSPEEAPVLLALNSRLAPKVTSGRLKAEPCLLPTPQGTFRKYVTLLTL